ncbi:MAG: hypothetical protein LBK53_03380 [Heliobacteriaceae bacterium]|jgi:hypothetical protein|nr:hypothetical protein [Heliobacteriaceae bacterium]
MSVQKISKYALSFKSDPAVQKPPVTPVKNEDKPETGYLVAAVAVGSAIIGGITATRRCNFRIKNLKGKVGELEVVNREIEQKCSAFRAKAEEYTKKLCNIQEEKNALERNFADFKTKVSELIDNTGGIPKDVKEKAFTTAKAKLEKSSLDYDPLVPPAKKSAAEDIEGAITLPQRHIPTQNRANMINQDIPEFVPGQKYEFELPMSNEVKIVKNSGDFVPTNLSKTTISESYADSVQWNNDKIARDVMQNFYDGHGQTLDGVKMSFTPFDGKYRVRIEGKSTYTPDKAVLIGESTKREDAKAAGNYGEGLKMAVLKLLKDSGAKNVSIGADNWNLVYKFADSGVNNKRVLAYSLEKADKFDGNFVEFETTAPELLKSFQKTVNRFYHSNNPHFKCPEFENELFGIKILPDNEQGGLYIAGQRFEVDGSYDGLKGCSIFLKEKPPTKAKLSRWGNEELIYDPSRDRTSLNGVDLQQIGKYLAFSPKTKQEELVTMLHSFEKYWDANPNEVLNEVSFLKGLLEGARARGLKIKFPDKYIADYYNASDELKAGLIESGYKLCNEGFDNIGMPSIKTFMEKARAHKVLAPDDVQTGKILILKEALKKFSPHLRKIGIKPEELDAKIYLFDAKSAAESKFYENTHAEAITEGGKSLGFWVDRNYLNKADFAEIVSTGLHEVTHKFGGDESMEFSYKLTDVLTNTIDSMITDPVCRTELSALQRLWNELPKTAV